VTLRAVLRDGSSLSGETRISKAPAPIERVSLKPADCMPLPETLQKLEEADIITLGPGSLFTSLIPTLLVPGIPQALMKSRALRLFVTNLMTQPTETTGY